MSWSRTRRGHELAISSAAEVLRIHADADVVEGSIGRRRLHPKRDTLGGLRDALLDDNLDVRTEYEILALPDATAMRSCRRRSPTDPTGGGATGEASMRLSRAACRAHRSRSTGCLSPSGPRRERADESNRSEPGVASLFRGRTGRRSLQLLHTDLLHVRVHGLPLVARDAQHRSQ